MVMVSILSNCEKLEGSGELGRPVRSDSDIVVRLERVPIQLGTGPVTVILPREISEIFEDAKTGHQSNGAESGRDEKSIETR
jgi:hypothetical protein